ncbi:hypothetical protein BGZ60DRAFT_402131 [Tricladium varicosporioides]|nr:hypothetical protein BGZ60DRAFT_402131 [Hymenoscyphus varicosporioides]
MSDNWVVPIHERVVPMNPQSSSPFFNGRIPPEIRDSIFQYALTQYTKTDPESQYKEKTSYNRPGYTGKKAVCIAFLLTCRRVYHETYHLVPENKEHVFWHCNGPPVEGADRDALYGRWGSLDEIQYFKKLQDWQLSLVKEIHLFTQMYWLEGSFALMCQKRFMEGIERVKITIRRGDWWWNEHNKPLSITPHNHGSQYANAMLGDWKKEERGHILEFINNSWGAGFARLASLKELELEMETSDDKRDELMAIVKKAKTWRFPMGKDTVLSTEGLKEKTSTWQPADHFWSDLCPYCGNGKCVPSQEEPLKGCVERQRLMSEGKGPLCHVVSIKWRLVSRGCS